MGKYNVFDENPKVINYHFRLLKFRRRLRRRYQRMLEEEMELLHLQKQEREKSLEEKTEYLRKIAHDRFLAYVHHSKKSLRSIILAK